MARTYVTRQEAARVRSVSLKVIDALIRSGELPVKRFGRCVRVVVDADPDPVKVQTMTGPAEAAAAIEAAMDSVRAALATLERVKAGLRS